MNKLHETIQFEMELCIPIVTRLVNRKQIRKEPWLSGSLKKCIDKNKRLYTKMLKNRNDKRIGDHYLAYNKTLRKALKVAKWEFHQEQCREFQQNTKKLWQLINKIS